MIGDGFKAHDARHGPKLGQSLASGVSGLARRFGADNRAERVEAARAKVRAEIEARRLPAAKVVTVVERVVVEQGTGEQEAAVKAVSRPTGKLGRPKVEGVRPWDAAGVSRRTWERRRKKEAGDGRA